MEQRKLKKLLSEMSLREKIGQMIQLTGIYFDDDAVLTGEVGEDQPPQWVTQYAGSVLGMIGAEKLRGIQKKYVEAHPHHIPLLFMLDVINGYKTVFPIPLAQGASFEPELSEQCASVAAKEASVSGLHVTFAPMTDLVRDARWGRVMESTGEDLCSNGAWISGKQPER